MQNNAPVPGQQPPGAPQDAKSVKQKKKEEAEKLKKLQQEKRRQLELNVQLNSFSKTLANSVMDIPTMNKFACNTLKSMLGLDHSAIAVFEEHPEIREGLLCVCNAEANLPKLPKPATPQPQQPKKDKKEENKKKEDDEDKEPQKPKPTFPVAPKEPPKPGALPYLENIIWDMPLVYKIRELKQPAMIPDATKFPDPQVNNFANIYKIKSMLFLPITNQLPLAEGQTEPAEEVVGVFLGLTVNDYKVLNQIEISSSQKAIQSLAKSIENAPPDLPVKVKKIITQISKDPTSDKLLEYYENILDDIFETIVYEIEPENLPENFKKLLEEKEGIGEESKLKKVWFQINELVKAEGDIGSIARRSIQEFTVQAAEFTKAKSGVMPVGLKPLAAYMKKNLKYSEMSNLGLEEEVILSIEEQIDNALRGKALFTEKSKAVLINDIEQSNMLLNYISAPASIDFRNHIKAAIEEDADCPDEVDKEALLSDMCYYGLAEISKSVCQDLVERVLFELPEFLEQPQEKQSEQSEALVTHFHRKIMANLCTSIKGKKNPWVNMVAEKIKERAKEAAKKRAVLVGRIKGVEQEDEEY